MLLPYINEIPTTRTWNDVFYGYNHNLRIGEGEFYDMKNMTGDDFPVLSPRGKRGKYPIGSPDVAKPRGLIAKDSLCHIDGGRFIINNDYTNAKDFDLTTDYDDDGKVLPKKLVSMGSYVIIMPDKKYINTLDANDSGDIEVWFLSQGTVKFTPCLLNGTNIDVTVSNVAPEKNDGKYWLDTSELPAKLKVYSSATDNWTEVATSYIKIEADGIGSKFNVGDAVTISGVKLSGLDKLNASTIIMGKEDGYIIVTGTIEKDAGGGITQDTPICVSRWMPELDFVIESQNRLWGCRYGRAYQGMKYDEESKMAKPSYGAYVNEIYCCKLGDFKNWNCFQGIASDSYVVTVGTDGYFTGAVTHLGYPIFFKESYMHKVYGNYPSNYQVQTTACRGVQKGCDRSVAIVNEIVYYKGRSGIMAYDGSLPIEISGALGDVNYSDARAGYLGNKYYVSMKDYNNIYSLFVYDTKKGMWHREDNTEALVFCNCRGDLYYIDYADNSIMTVKGSGVTDDRDVEWGVETGYIGTDSPDKKYVSRLDVRMKLAPGARASFYADYDSLGSWEHLFNMTGVNLQSFAVPIKPKRCDHMRLKIDGVGEAKIFSICKTVEWGSDK